MENKSSTSKETKTVIELNRQQKEELVYKQRAKFNRAMRNHDFATAQAMIDAGYIVHNPDSANYTNLYAIYMALGTEMNYEGVQLLLKGGGDPDWKNNFDKSFNGELEKKPELKDTLQEQAYDYLKVKFEEELKEEYDSHKRLPQENVFSLENILEKSPSVELLKATFHKLNIKSDEDKIKQAWAAAKEASPFLQAQAEQTEESELELMDKL